MRVNVHPNLDPFQFEEGQLVVLNEAFNVVEPSGYVARGEIASIVDFIADNRAIVLGHTDDERVVTLAEPLRREKLKVGDSVLFDPRTHYAFEKLPKSSRRRGRARRDPGCDVRADRRARRADPDPARFGRAAVPLPGRVRRAQAQAAEGHPAVRAAGLRQDADREGRREQPGAQHREAHGQGHDRLLPEREGPRAASTSTSARRSTSCARCSRRPATRRAKTSRS